MKLLFIKQLDQSLLDSPSADDIFGNLNEGALKLLSVQNNKGMTPLVMSIDEGNYQIFRFLLEIYHYNDQITKRDKILPKVISLKYDKGESPLLLAARTNQVEMVYSLLHLGDNVITYDILKEVDS